MIDNKILSKNATITFGGGEPTILQEFEELVYLLLDYDVYNIRIHSDGIIYHTAPAGMKGREMLSGEETCVSRGIQVVQTI